MRERAQYCLLIGAVPDFSYTYSDYRVYPKYPSVKVTNIFFVFPANCFTKLYIIQALLRSLSPFLENERGRVDTCLRNKSRNKLRSTLLSTCWTQLKSTSFATTRKVLQ